MFASGVGANGDNVRYAIMDSTERSSYIVLDPATGAPAAWLNGCKDTGCPDPSSTCQFLGADETCIFGYEACLQKMGCGGRAQEVDCIGNSSGMFSSRQTFCSSLANTKVLGCSHCDG